MFKISVMVRVIIIFLFVSFSVFTAEAQEYVPKIESHAGLNSAQEVVGLPLETCYTMNGKWGYNCTDLNYKSADELIRMLVQTSGRGANFLLNVGSQPNGEFPNEAVNRLRQIGEWMRQYGETIYGTTAGEPGEQEWGGVEFGRQTAGGRLYNRNNFKIKSVWDCSTNRAEGIAWILPWN